jgi:cold shock CspA family protein
MAETFNKKEKQQRKKQKQKEKEQRKAERKANSQGKKSFEDMIAYIDENGNITSTPPDPSKKKTIKESDIVIGSRNIGGAQPDALRKGKLTNFNTAKGYGFIKDLLTQENFFVHVNSFLTPVKENDFVTFQTERGPKGMNAVAVKKL